MGQTERGRFITIEGTDGAGKSTQGRFIESYLRRHGIDCLHTREPGGTPMGEAIRSLLLDKTRLEATPATELLLVFAARAQHIAEVIEPALARGTYVLCDRFTDATYAYQGAAGGLGFDAVSRIEEWVQGDLRPDVTLLFDVPVDVGLERTRERGIVADRFEAMARANKEKVRDAYLQLAAAHTHRIRVIDATAPVESVNERVRDVLSEKLSEWGRS